MKNLITTLTILITFMSLGLSQRSEGQSFVEYYTAPDKLLHIGAGFSISGLTTTIYATARPDEPLINSVGVGIIIGTLSGGLKEVAFDHYGGLGMPDAGDFYATMYGSVLGSLTTALSIKLSRRWMCRRYYKNKDLTVTDFRTGKKLKL